MSLPILYDVHGEKARTPANDDCQLSLDLGDVLLGSSELFERCREQEVDALMSALARAIGESLAAAELAAYRDSLVRPVLD
jgi:hypothetical protein